VTENRASTSPPQVLQGLLAEFSDPAALLTAARGIRDAQWRAWDSYSPFPVHGLDRAMGIRPTILPWLAMGAGISGLILALLMQWWMNAVDYPLNISGKPLFSLPANIPVAFELIVLFSAVTAFLGALALNGLPRYNNPLFRQASFRRATSDRFFISLDARDPVFDPAGSRRLLESLGATSVEEVYGPATPAPIPLQIHLVGVVVLLLAMIPPLWIAMERRSKSDVPRVHPVLDMDSQPKYLPQAESAFFADGRTMRLPVAGTVTHQERIDDEHFERGLVDGQFATSLPDAFVPVSPTQMRRGRERYDIFCATCHGLVGEGDGITSQRALARPDSAGWVKPLSLHAESVREQPVGKLFNSITHGIRTMPAYESQIPPADRWAIILYVLALQRSQSGSLDDLPAEERRALEMRDFRN
jgi:mono/diheme cytochrome c family protein